MFSQPYRRGLSNLLRLKKRALPLAMMLSFLSIGLSGMPYSHDRVEIDFGQGPSPDGIPPGWILKERTGEAQIKLVREDGEIVAHFRSEGASFSLEKSLEIDPGSFPIITWSWKVLSLPRGGDMRSKKKNDQAAQILVAFESGKILGYIWDSNAPEGTISDESIPWPINVKVKVIVVKSGPSDLNKWIRFRRNIAEDFRILYNEKPSMIKGVRIQINSQHTGTVAEAMFGKIAFLRS